MKVFDFYAAGCESIVKKDYGYFSEYEQKDILENAIQLIAEGKFLSPIEAVDRAVDEYLISKEYKEFIRLLRMFVDNTEPRIDHANVIFIGNNSFKLIDDEGNKIDNEYLEEFVTEIVDGEINFEDIIISTLICLAPKVITLHTKNFNDQNVKMVQDIFGSRVNLCNTCNLCN